MKNGSNQLNKSATCKYCGANDLVWLIEGDRWSLTESYGLPHGCTKKSEFFRNQMNEKNAALKKQYADEKARLEAIPNGSNCPACLGAGIHYGVYYGNSLNSVKCETCYGSGKVTQKQKNIRLYKLRLRLWPTLLKKNK